MECNGCGSQRKSFYCERCIKQGLSSHASATSVLATQLELSRSRCERILSGPSSNSSKASTAVDADLPTSDGSSTVARPSRSTRRRRGLDSERHLRSDVFVLGTSVADLSAEVSHLEQRVEERKTALRARKQDVERRRKHLADARRSVDGSTEVSSYTFDSTPRHPGTYPLKVRTQPTVDRLVKTIASVRAQTSEVHERLARARRILVEEAIDVFEVKQSGRRDVAASRSRRKDDAGERWMIAGLEIGGPRSFPDYNSIHLNGVLQHIVHLLSLIVRYLGVCLPFSPYWSDDAGSTVSADVASFVLATKHKVDKPQEIPGPKHIGKLMLSAHDSLPFTVVPKPRSSSAVQELVSGVGTPATDSTDSAAARPEFTDLLDGRPRMLYVSSGRERWRKAEAEKNKASIGRGTGKGAGRSIASAVLVEKPKIEDRPPVESSSQSTTANQSKPGSKTRTNSTSAEVTGPPDVQAASAENGTTALRKDKRTRKEEQLVDSFSMLAYDLLYLASTQGIDVSKEALGTAGLLVRWINALRGAPALGEVSHESAKVTLRAVNLPVNLVMVRQQLQQEFTDNEGTKRRSQSKVSASPAAHEDLEEWDIV